MEWRNLIAVFKGNEIIYEQHKKITTLNVKDKIKLFENLNINEKNKIWWNNKWLYKYWEWHCLFVVSR